MQYLIIKKLVLDPTAQKIIAEVNYIMLKKRTNRGFRWEGHWALTGRSIVHEDINNPDFATEQDALNAIEISVLKKFPNKVLICK